MATKPSKFSSLFQNDEEPVGDGWLRAGVVADDVEAVILTVYWHPGTDRVKVQRPPDPDAIPTPSPVGRPGLTVSLGVRRAYRASPGYRYFLDGVEHSPEEAERIAQERDSLTGWTWRPRSPQQDAPQASPDATGIDGSIPLG